MINTKIKLITFFVVEDEEAMYTQQKKTWSWLQLRSSAPHSKIQV